MGSIKDNEIYGTFRYSLPDDSVPVQQRSLYTGPSSKLVKDISHKLHDFRTDPAFTKGGAGLDVQGFTYVQHTSVLSGDEFFEGRNVEDVYGPEVCELLKSITGAKRAIVDGATLRSRLATQTEEDLYHVKLKDGPQDQALKKFDPSVMRVPGRDRKNAPFEPLRVCHADYDCQGLKDTIRCCRKDISDMARPSVEAEDRGESPRYAVYSVWRPIKPISRDPLGVLDWRTVDKSEIEHIQTRAMSAITPEGEYLRGSLAHIPPKNPENLRWAYMSDQKPDKVLILKFADTAAGELGAKDESMAAHCIHGSPSIPGTENEPARESIECRVIAFWQ